MAEELGDSIPRRVRLRRSSELLIIFLISLALFLILIFYRCPSLYLGLVGGSVFVWILTLVHKLSAQRKMVQNWERIIGIIECRWDDAYQCGASIIWNVKYQHEEKTFHKTVEGFPGGRAGDPAFLLLDPQKPESCVSYNPSFYGKR